MKPKGGDGGHNGLADVARAAGGDSYARLRLGVDSKPQGANQAGYVLGRFTQEQSDTLKPALKKAADAAEFWVKSGLAEAMNRFNTPEEKKARGKKPKADPSCDTRSETMHLKRLPRVHRPGIAVTIPSFGGPLILCDAGANPEPQPTHLWQYGVMAEAYARTVLHIDKPRVALMNIGAEEGKGTELIQKTRALLLATPGINFTGYIEGRDFFDGAADVVVTDGFVGNTVLKMAEGLARSLFSAIAQAIFAEDPELALRIEPAIKALYSKSDYEELGGAPLLGVNGTYIIAHGSSKAKTIAASIRNGFEYLRLGLNDVLMQRIVEVEAGVDADVMNAMPQ